MQSLSIYIALCLTYDFFLKNVFGRIFVSLPIKFCVWFLENISFTETFNMA